jgi:hypothetical protein
MPERSDDDLDLYALEPTRLEEDSPTQEGPAPVPVPRGRLFPAVLAGLALLAVAALALLFLTLRRPVAPAAATAGVEPTPAPRDTPQAPEPPRPAPLPGLDESDDYVRRAAAAVSANPELARWLAQTSLVRTATAVVVNVADGESPRPHLGFLAPARRFAALRRKGRTLADPAGFTGYDGFGDALASVDVALAASSYRLLEPLFDAACRELGHPEGGFRAVLGRAIAVLLETPLPAADAELVPHGPGFRYADASLERLTPAQKQFLRIGPRNARLVQGKLREFQAALGRDAASR